MSNLLISSWKLAQAQALGVVARHKGWNVIAWDEGLAHPLTPTAFYGTTDVVLEVLSQVEMGLLEPPLDFLARIPKRFLNRAVEFATFGDLQRLRSATFIKPADPLAKVFDAGIYSDPAVIRSRRPIPPSTPLLLAEPVEWTAEYRCFVQEGQIVAFSPYLSYGRPVWKAFHQGGSAALPSQAALGFCRNMLQCGCDFPPAFVVDIGFLEGRGWAVVEFNPVWCSGLLGADPEPILQALVRATRPKNQLSPHDQKWKIR